MTQTSLFDAGPADALWRKGQTTSKASARTVDVSGRESEIVSVMRGRPSMTTAEIQAHLVDMFGAVRERNTIARRLTTLERKGIVARCGVELGARGVTRTTWRLL